MFDPDPQKRDLAQTGVMQRVATRLDPAAKAQSEAHLAQLVAEFSHSPK